MKKKIKIFLALGEGLYDEGLELADLVESLNLILETLNIHIYLTKWDYISDSVSEENTEVYDSTLAECDICMVVFGSEFGSFKDDELKKAYKRVCQAGVNPKKLYVYFKNEDARSEEFKRFRDSFQEEYGHFSGRFTDVNALKNDFLLQFQLFQSQHLHDSCPVEVNEGKVTVLNEVLDIDLMKIPFLGNNMDYINEKNIIQTLKDVLSVLNPENEVYSQTAKQLKDLEEKHKKREQSIWNTAIDIADLKNQKCSDRLRKAIEYFNAGNNKEASAILDTNDLIKDADYNIYLIELGKNGSKGLKILIKEFNIKIKTLQNEMSDGWRDQTIELQEKLIKCTKKVYGENSKKFISSLLRGGATYSSLGQLKRALHLQEQALDLSKKIADVENGLIARCFDNVGATYGKYGDLQKALEYQQKALDIRIKIYGREHPVTATSLNNVGEKYRKLKDYQKALEYLQRALDIRMKVHGVEHPATSTCLNNIGVTYSKLRDHRKALEYEQRALDIRMKVFGVEHTETATCFNNIGITYGKLGDHRKALEYEKRALDIHMKVFGAEHPITASCLNNVGITYGKLGDFRKRLECSLKCLNIRLKIFGEDSKYVCSSFHNLGTIYRTMGDFRNALKYRKKELEWHLRNSRDKSRKIEVANNNVGAQYRDLGEYDKALEYISNAYVISKETGRTGEEASYLNRLGRVYALMGDKETAKAKFEEAINLLPEDHPETHDSKECLRKLQ